MLRKRQIKHSDSITSTLSIRKNYNFYEDVTLLPLWLFYLVSFIGVVIITFYFATLILEDVESGNMPAQALSSGDPSSYSRPDIAVVTSFHLNLAVNFEKKTFSGNVHLNISKVDPSATQIILDSKDLNISKIIDEKTKNEVKFTFRESNGEFGKKLTVELPPENTSTLNVFYETSPQASGLQWLSPQQTQGKKHPYVFSQFQAIHARSFMPCQDTPSVKSPYSAEITAPRELTVLMSALAKGVKEYHDKKIYTFDQPVRIPSYLTAIAIGNLEKRQIGPRSHVWAEPEIVEKCAHEFDQTENQLKTAEEICGPYVWGVYDLLVLPPSFAFGGMENPCLTFVTPTLLAGDKSLANVVAHEIAHSWTGNLITNRNFEHFWLNEGFTVLIERKIKGRLTSAKDEDFCAVEAVGELKQSIQQLGVTSPVTQLVVNLTGLHPDDAFSIVPYEKGYIFLRYLQNTVGGAEEFEPFLKKYFEAFKYKSIDTNDFRKFFEEYFAKKESIKSIDWNTWLHTPGMPKIIPEYDRTIADECDKLVKDFLDWNGAEPVAASIENLKNYSTYRKIYVMQKLVEQETPLPIKKLEYLDKTLGLTTIENAEIKFRWFRMALKAKYIPVVDSVLSWLGEVGRMKYVRPLYRNLYAWPEVRQKAIDNFHRYEKTMMHVVTHVVMQDLHLTEL